MPSPPLTDVVADAALRAALDEAAAAKLGGRAPKSRWTLDIDKEIWRANKELGLGSRPISRAMQAVHGWGSRGTVESRLATLREHGGPDKVPR